MPNMNQTEFGIHCSINNDDHLLYCTCLSQQVSQLSTKVFVSSETILFLVESIFINIHGIHYSAAVNTFFTNSKSIRDKDH